MIWATEYKHVDLVKLLLSKGSDINIRDNVSVPAAAGRQCRGGGGAQGRAQGLSAEGSLPSSWLSPPPLWPVWFSDGSGCRQLLDAAQRVEGPERDGVSLEAHLTRGHAASPLSCVQAGAPRPHPRSGRRRRGLWLSCSSHLERTERDGLIVWFFWAVT